MLRDTMFGIEHAGAMTNRQELVERRNHKRFRVREGGYAALLPQFTEIGQILDISRGGLAFRYVASQERSHQSSQLSISSTDGSFSLNKVPIKTVWDFALANEFSFGAITLRHCGVQFGQLTPAQKSDLEYFIQTYTLGES